MKLLQSITQIGLTKLISSPFNRALRAVPTLSPTSTRCRLVGVFIPSWSRPSLAVNIMHKTVEAQSRTGYVVRVKISHVLIVSPLMKNTCTVLVLCNTKDTSILLSVVFGGFLFGFCDCVSCVA